ncbi:MAG: monovalent cation/H+ antiporter complex subunit F [Trueperaceae bacterium]|nr:monovalent cation/H+ antiporter complex subunit F [Trueperaceae bacterium]
MILFEAAPSFLGFATYAAIVAIVASIAAAAVRVLRGPSLSDRVLALDMIGLLSVSFIAVVAIASHQEVLLDAAIALALVSFLGTVAFARFIERRGEGDA